MNSPDQCPLCHQPNDCVLCTETGYKAPCWCAKIKIPEELIAQISPDLRNKACICRACVTSFYQRKITGAPAQKTLPRDFY